MARFHEFEMASLEGEQVTFSDFADKAGQPVASDRAILRYQERRSDFYDKARAIGGIEHPYPLASRLMSLGNQ